jgi:cytoskeletal protein CcmA (bactofilin family)
MAWFDRNPGGKKEPEAQKVPEPVKPPVQPTPAATAPAPEPKPAPQEVTPPPVPAQPSEPGLVGHLFKGSRISGQLSFQGSARIDGSVDGEIQCQGNLTIGESAEVRAKIYAQVVVIRGKVEGNVTAKDKAELVTPARLIGNIETPRLIIGEGVVFDGDCSMGAKQKGGVVSSHAVGADNIAAAQAAKLQADSKS